MRLKIKVRYILDNENWSDGQYEDAQDIENEFEITEDMIVDLIRQNSNLEKGDYVESVYYVSKSN